MTTIILGHTADSRAIGLPLRLANRHGLITGATGTGKTVTLQRLAEGFSAAGVPVFAADIKGDLSGLAAMGVSDPSPSAVRDGSAKDEPAQNCAASPPHPNPLPNGERERAVPAAPQKFPVRFWDLFGEAGIPIRTSVHEMGPLLLARMLGLNDTQEGILNIAFRWTPWGDGLPMRDLHDLRARLAMMLDHAEHLQAHYGHVTASSIAVIQRAILALDIQGGHHLFGEPALDIRDFLRTVPAPASSSGASGVRGAGAKEYGTINLLHADHLMDSPKLYATFLLWLLSSLFNALPEVGDADKPKLVFFFDEAHLLFADAPKRLMEVIERVVRLIRSRGVGVYFVTQSPRDVPDAVQGQLGHRIQHAMRVFTPKDQRMVKAAVDGLRPNPGVDVAAAITAMATGEALVSTLVGDGVPCPVERVRIARPVSQIGPVSDFERDAALRADPVARDYRVSLDREAQFRALCDRLVAKGELAAPAPIVPPAASYEATVAGIQAAHVSRVREWARTWWRGRAA